MDFQKQLMSAGRWNQSALKPHLVSNCKNIKDYYPRHQKGHEHLLQRAHAKFRRTNSQGTTETIQFSVRCVRGYFFFAYKKLTSKHNPAAQNITFHTIVNWMYYLLPPLVLLFLSCCTHSFLSVTFLFRSAKYNEKGDILAARRSPSCFLVCSCRKCSMNRSISVLAVRIHLRSSGNHEWALSASYSQVHK